MGAAITGAPGDKNDAGLVSFDDTAFSVDANGYVTLLGGGTGIETLTGDDAVATGPDGVGNLDLTGLTVANATNAKPVYVNGGTNAEVVEVQVSAAITGAPGDKNDAGLSSFNDTHFTVDADGYVSLLGGGGAGAVMHNIGDDSVSVDPDGAGNFYWLGSTVANATNAKPVYFKDSATANAIDLDVQVGTAVTGAPGDKNDAGLVSFNDTQFTVDADGYVALVGGADLPSIQTLTGDDAVVTGPDASGNMDIQGLAVANATNAKPLYFNGGTNSEVAEIQVSAAVTGAPGDKNDAGICSFDDTSFAVDADGYVTLASTGPGETITGDSGGALPTTANNWNILGGPGVTTSGSGSTLTINSVVYTDQTATTLTSDSGTFATAAGAYTLPAAPTDGELVEIVCITSGIIVTANTGQEIQIAGDVTSTAGNATNSAKGDVLCLRYRSTDTAWYATSVCGVWVLA